MKTLTPKDQDSITKLLSSIYVGCALTIDINNDSDHQVFEDITRCLFIIADIVGGEKMQKDLYEQNNQAIDNVIKTLKEINNGKNNKA